MNYNIKEIYDWPLIPRSAVMGIICLIVFYIGYYVDLSRLTRKLDIIKLQEMDLKTQFSSLAVSMSVVNNDLIKYPVLVDTLAQLQKELIISSDLPELLSQILKMGAQNELKFNYFIPGPEKKVGNHFKVPIKIVVIGTYDQIASFMSQIANMDRLVAVQSIFLEKKDQSKIAIDATEVGNRLSAELILDVYEAKSK